MTPSCSSVTLTAVSNEDMTCETGHGPTLCIDACAFAGSSAGFACDSGPGWALCIAGRAILKFPSLMSALPSGAQLVDAVLRIDVSAAGASNCTEIVGGVAAPWTPGTLTDFTDFPPMDQSYNGPAPQTAGWWSVDVTDYASAVLAGTTTDEGIALRDAQDQNAVANPAHYAGTTDCTLNFQNVCAGQNPPNWPQLVLYYR